MPIRTFIKIVEAGQRLPDENETHSHIVKMSGFYLIEWYAVPEPTRPSQVHASLKVENAKMAEIKALTPGDTAKIGATMDAEEVEKQKDHQAMARRVGRAIGLNISEPGIEKPHAREDGWKVTFDGEWFKFTNTRSYDTYFIFSTDLFEA